MIRRHFHSRYLTDLGPTCPDCGSEGLWGYSYSRPIVYAQCGCCRYIEAFDMPGGPADPMVGEIRQAHHDDRTGSRFVGTPVNFTWEEVISND